MSQKLGRLLTVISLMMALALTAAAQDSIFPDELDDSDAQVRDSLLHADLVQRQNLARADSLARAKQHRDSLRAEWKKRQQQEYQIKKVTLGTSETINFDSIELQPNLLFAPLVFVSQQAYNDSVTYLPSLGIDKGPFDYDTSQLDSLTRATYFQRSLRYRTMINNPEIVRYNIDMLPEPLKQYEIVADPSSRTLKIEETNVDPLAAEIVQELEVPQVKARRWLHSFDAALQFSQAYVSDNWYQGGTNNLNVLGNMMWKVALNQNVYPNLLFENTVQYKLNMSSAPQDSIRNYSISEDLFQVNTKFGYKAARNWYYTATMQFKTQLLNNYTANTNDLTASLLTPGELNLGLGMTYGTKSKNGYVTFDLSVAPLSYNLKICRENDRVDPTTMGIEAGKHFKGDFGSNLEAKLSWAITPAISWSSRLYAFTNYDYVQGDWENTLNFSINKYLSTQLYLHLRFDDSTESTSDWGNWQMKEILSFGLRYSFAMN